MRDFEIRSLGANQVTNSANVSNVEIGAAQKQQRTFSDVIKNLFPEQKLTPAKTITITDLNMPIGMKRKLVEVVSMQHRISDKVPELNNEQKNLVIGDDYIKDTTFKAKAFSEV